nr:retrotransposon protein, putative, unclassified [Tanacetum cinerariifolium]
MKHVTDLHCFDVHNDGYYSHLPLSYVNGVILNMAVPRMPYKKFAEYLEEIYGNYFQGGSSQHPQKIDKGKDATKGVEAMTSTKDNGKEKVSQDTIKGVEARTSTADIDHDSEFDSDDDNEYDSHKSVDYLSPDEEELIELRNRIKANKEAKAKGKAYGEVGEKYVTVEHFKECLIYYALANGFSLWYEKSSGKKMVAKYGQRPPRLSVPNKGKLRKQSRYPSVSRDELLACPWRCYARYTQLFSYLMKSHFKVSMMGEMMFFLGLNQSNYVLEILKKYRMESCDPVGTPMEIKDKLDLDQNGTPVDATKYHSMIDADYAGCKDTLKSTSGGEKLVS